MNANEIARKIYYDDDGQGRTTIERIESIIAAALAEKDAVIALMRDELSDAKIRSNHYAKRLVLEGYDDVIWFGLPLWPPDEPKEVKP
jgi:hypothetical protein